MRDKKIEVMEKDMARLLSIKESSLVAKKMMEDSYAAFLAMGTQKKYELLHEIFELERVQFREKIGVLNDIISHIDTGIIEDHPDLPITTANFRKQLEDELEKTKYFEKLLEEVIILTEKGGEI